MLTEVEAVRFDKVMANGKTKPIMLACERSTGEEVEIVAKFSFGCNNSPESLVREAIASMLAKDLGLPIPEPFIVSVTPEFINSIDDQNVVAYLRQSIELGFGCRKLPDGYATWTSNSGKLTDEGLRTQALEILAYDCFVSNADRRPSNPNLLFNGKLFAIFDHEMAFMTNLNMSWTEPWKSGALGSFYHPKTHVLYPVLKSKEVNLQRLAEAFGKITNDRINEYGYAIPTAWHGSEKAVERAITFIPALRDNIESAIDELKRALV